MLRSIVFAVFLTVGLTAAYGQKAVGCVPASDAATVVRGSLIEINAGKARKISGMVTDVNGVPLEGIRLQVYEDRGTASNFKGSLGRILISCETGPGGRYAFEGLRKGNYIVAASGAAFNTTFVRFKLRPSRLFARRKYNFDMSVPI